MRVLTTESGARYEIDGDMIRRVEGSDGNRKRADGEWVRLLQPLPEYLVGFRAILALESLSHLGPDDYGAEGGMMTTRTTTPVVSDEWA